MGRGLRMQAGFALVAALGVAVTGGSAWLLLGGSDVAACGNAIPHGRTLNAAWDTTELFVADVLLNARPACGYDLSTRHLRHGHSRGEWASGEAGVHRFATRYPAVSITRASRDPRAHQAVYILSRRVSDFVVVDDRGRVTIPMMVGLAAPDAGRGAYNLVLVVEGGSWRVDAVRRVTISDTEHPAAG